MQIYLSKNYKEITDMIYSLHGLWKVKISDELEYDMNLPGTLDENHIGFQDESSNKWHPDVTLGNKKEFGGDNVIATRFTRKYTYEGKAYISRRITYLPPKGKRIFLEVERARCLKLYIDDKEVPEFIESSMSTPHIFEVTGYFTGDNQVTFLSDNSYEGLPHDQILYSSAATDETQTNWNGLLGFIQLREEAPVFISNIRVYPKKENLLVQVEMEAASAYQGQLRITSEAIVKSESCEILLEKGRNIVEINSLSLKSNIAFWEEEEGNLYEITAQIIEADSKTVSFGVRYFTDNGNGKFSINGRTLFLRSEANCAEFPETGYAPMTESEWITILKKYRSYGVNCMRFHSHCPPEAAFYAADKLGMFMQPELSHWDPVNAFESGESFAYYKRELIQVIQWLANHPSFVMLSFGNELMAGELGHQRMRELLILAQEIDSTRLYAEASNSHYGGIECEQQSDFYTTQSYFDYELRGAFACHDEKKERIQGYINNKYPDARSNYDSTMAKIRESYKKPVFSFEVGQFEVLPDFDELMEFQGISEPANLKKVQKKVEEAGLTHVWKDYVEATGELALIGYREEVEAALRTKMLGGISLLGLQDFPGQGTALVGMMNSHLKPKPFPFAAPEKFKAFFCDQLPLVLLPQYTYEIGEVLNAEVIIVNYGKSDIRGEITYELNGAGQTVKGKLKSVVCKVGGLTAVGQIEINLDFLTKTTYLNLEVSIGTCKNNYPVWVYTKEVPKCPEGIYQTEALDEKAVELLEQGGKVYLSPKSTKEALPSSIQAQFTTDFWSVGTFPKQPGGMGQLIDKEHPIFSRFPTQKHSNWQWWPMASQRAIIFPQPVEAIITLMDSYAYLRNMAQLVECNCGKGKLILSSLGLQNLQNYKEARALQAAIYHYMESNDFLPKQELSYELLRSLVI